MKLAVQRLSMYKEDASIALQVLKPGAKKKAKKATAEDVQEE